jgi:hypothetical protein
MFRGYIEAIREIEQQIQRSADAQFDDIVVACGRYLINTLSVPFMCNFVHGNLYCVMPRV